MSSIVANEPTPYDRLFRLSLDLFLDHHYESAYHSLAAAYHYAADVNDQAKLLQIEMEAARQLNVIDLTTPNYKFSSLSTEQRHGVNIYKSLIKQVQVHLKLLKLIAK
ncbi:MAG: hypothetical protein U0528_02435 [Anaerolineae bacterium]|nr:hypothetical protein [Anaerolineae bacterium]